MVEGFEHPVVVATCVLRRARAAQLDDIAAAVAAGDWRSHRSPAGWLSASTGESLGACITTIQTAERLQQMPLVRAAFGEGGLAESALRLVCDTWSADIAVEFGRDEAMLLRWAQRLGVKDLRLVLATWRARVEPDPDGPSPDAYDRRRLHLSTLLDGMVQIDALLEPEAAAIVRQALRDAMPPARTTAERLDDDRTPAQRRADALVAVCVTAVAAAHQSGRLHHRNQSVVTVAYDDLIGGAGGGVLDTPDGPIPLSTDAVRRLCCDSEIHRLIWAADGSTINYGRSTRTVTDSQYQRILIRDHGCRRCGAPPAHTQVHHAVEWSPQNGRTDDANLLMLCGHDHHLVHDQHWSIEPLGAGHFVLTDPQGVEHPLRPPNTGHTLFELVPSPPRSGHAASAAAEA